LFSSRFLGNPNLLLFMVAVFLLTVTLVGKPFTLLNLLILTSLLPISYKYSATIPDLFMFDYLISVMFLILLLQTCCKGKISIIRLSKVEVWLVLLLIVAGISILANIPNIERFGGIYLKIVLVGLLNLIYIVTVYFFVSRVVDTEEKFKSVVYLLLFIGFINGISGLYMFPQVGAGEFDKAISLIGPYEDTFNLMFPVFNLSLCSLLNIRMRRIKKWALVFILFASSILLFGTLKRSIWGMVFISSFIIFTFKKGSKLSIKKMGYALLGLVCLVTVLLSNSVSRNKFFGKILSHPLDIGKGYGRGVLWKQGFEIFQNKPLIGTGIGSETFLGVIEKRINVVISQKVISVAGVHNQYLTVAIEMGIIGLFIFLVFCFGVLHATHQVFKSTENEFFKVVSLAFFANAFSFFIISMNIGGGILPVHDTLRTLLYFWIFCGLVGAIKRMEGCKTRWCQL